MQTTHLFKHPVAGFLMLVLLWVAGNTPTLAQDLAAPTQAVNTYLTSLITGDTQQLIKLVGGRMKQRNQQLFLNPGSYSRFLKDYYAGTRAVLEEMVPDGNRLQARVRFEYPAQESAIIVFILTQTEGRWMITDEISDTY